VGETEKPVAFIGRVPWLSPESPRFGGHIESETPTPHMIEEGPGWDDVEEAIAWGRARAPEVYVGLGGTGATYYSAGVNDPPPDPDYPDDVMPRWPPTTDRIAADLATIQRDPATLAPAAFQEWRDAAHELGAMRVRDAADRLLAVLSTYDHRVLEAAAVALFDIGDERLVERLVEALETADNANGERLIALHVGAQVLSCVDDPEARAAAARFYSRPP
jgi:hypothetical protein